MEPYDATITAEWRYEQNPMAPESGRPYPIAWHWSGGNVAHLSEMEARRQIGRDLAPGEEVTLGSLRLRVLWRGDFCRMGYAVTRELRWAWWYRFRHCVTKRWDLFFARLILTLCIWGLADYTPGARPSWRDIRLVARTRARLVTRSKR